MKPTPVTERPVNGLNLVDPEHRLRPGQVRKAQNIIMRHNKAFTPGGTARYNPDEVGGSDVTWVHRFYGRRADGTEIKKMFCYSDGKIYTGDDSNGFMTTVQTGLNSPSYPESISVQVSGRTKLFFFNGEGPDRPLTYDGNDSNTFVQSPITQEFVQGVVWLDRLWAFEANSNALFFSKTLAPEDFTDSTDAGKILIGQNETNMVAIVIFGDFLYIFKEDTIYFIQGRTPSEFSVRVVHPALGCNSRISVVDVETSIVFLGSDNELYSFRGSQATTTNITEELEFKNMINKNKPKTVTSVYHDSLLRVAFEPSEAGPGTVFNSDEIIAPILELNDKGLPKWGKTRGANIARYSIWDRFGDKIELLSGRSDKGLVMFHNRGNKYDDVVMDMILRTRDIVFSPGQNVRISHYAITGKAVGAQDMEFRTYLNTRLGDFSTNTYQPEGETFNVGLIKFSNQVRFNDRLIPQLNRSRGLSVSYEFISSTNELDFEIYDITAFVRAKEKITGQIVGA